MIQVTDTAAQQIAKQLKRRGHGIGIRIGVRTTGCSGLAYILEYVDQLAEGDDTVVFDGYAVVVNRRDQPILKGLAVDYVREGLNEGFKFTNPNEQDRCGCGESFRI